MRSACRHLASKRGLVCVGLELVLASSTLGLTGGALRFAWRAQAELPAAEAALRAAGYTLDVLELAAPNVPAEKNAGAIEPLLGVAATGTDRTPEIELRIQQLEELGLRTKASDARWNELTKRLLKDGTLDKELLKSLPVEGRPPQLHADRPIDWSEWVKWLRKLEWQVPPAEPADPALVFHALETKTAFLTGPLRAAAGRDFARATPSQHSRLAASIARRDLTLDPGSNTPFIGAIRILTLQMEAALASGKLREAADLVSLLFVLSEIAGGDVSLLDLVIRQSADGLLADAVRRNLGTGRMPAQMLGAFQRHFSARPGLEDMQRILNMELAWNCYSLDQIVQQRVSLDIFKSVGGFPLPNPENFRGKRSWIVEPLFRNLAALNRAAYIRHFLKNMEAWKAGGPLGWYHFASAQNEQLAAQGDGTAILRLDSVLAEGATSGCARLMPGLLFREMRRRFVPMVCALERHRLAGGAFPESLSALPKDLSPEIPADLDGKPIRYRRDADGWVLWSVGMNLQDDLRGDAPAPSNKDPRDQPDWQWRYGIAGRN